jgi:hypothetical protein
MMLALTVALAACGSSESGSSDSGSASSGSSGSTDTSDESAGTDTGNDASKNLKIGDETTLTGLHGDMKVKVLGIIDPLTADNEIPKPGRRFVGVRLRFQNLSNKPYKDAPLNGAIILTNVKKGANPTILLGSKCPSKMGTHLRMKGGATLTGCLPFQVKKKAKVTGFKFALNSGFGPETGEWAVK